MICDFERSVCIQISKIFPLLIERETPLMTRVVVLSSAMKVQREREREKVCSSERKTHFMTRSLSLSLSVFFFFFSFSLCFRAFFLSLSSLVRRGWNEK